MLKAVGILRRVDSLGRVVLPVEWRRHLQIEADTPVEILAKGQEIVVRKYVPGCLICGNREVQGPMRVCGNCRESLLAAGGQSEDSRP